MTIKPATEMDSDIGRSDFPDGFVFGTGTSSYQTEGAAYEGGRGLSVWDDFCLTPGTITDGSNGNVAVDMYHRFQEDFKLMKSLGFDAYRFSIAWPRILPGGKVCLGVNQEGITFYNNVINCLLDHGIEPYVTLFHWDLPLALELEYGGFMSKNVVVDFCEFTELCFRNFGDRVKKWSTLNEPWCYAVHGYVMGMFPPGEGYGKPETVVRKCNGVHSKPMTIDDPYKCAEDHVQLMPPPKPRNNINENDSTQKRDPTKDCYTVARNLLLAHATAVECYRTKFKEQQNGQIGITINSYWLEPYTDKFEDKEASKRAMDFMLGWFLEPVLTGHYPQNMKDFVPCGNLAPFTFEEVELLKGSIDFLGLNYYTSKYVENNPHAVCFGGEGFYLDQQVAFHTEKDGIPIGPSTGSDWQLVVPWGIRKILRYINTTYNNATYKLPPIYITENGIGETLDHKLTVREACIDKDRVNFFRAHLENVLKAINEDKVNVKGYFLWSWCDNFEWIFGYTVRFGIIYIDYMNGLTRHPKDSALWFSKFLAKAKDIKSA